MKRFVPIAALLAVFPTCAIAITVVPGLEFYQCEPGQCTFEFSGPTTLVAEQTLSTELTPAADSLRLGRFLGEISLPLWEFVTAFHKFARPLRS